MCRRQKSLKLGHRAVIRFGSLVIGHVVAVVARRLHHWHQPEAGHAQVGSGGGVAVVEVIELLGEAGKVALTIAVAVLEAAHKHLVEYGIIPPVRGVVGDDRSAPAGRTTAKAIAGRGIDGRRGVDHAGEGAGGIGRAAGGGHSFGLGQSAAIHETVLEAAGGRQRNLRLVDTVAVIIAQRQGGGVVVGPVASQRLEVTHHVHPGHRNSLPVHIHGEAQLRGALSKSHDGQVHGRSTHHYLPVHVATAIVHATGGRHCFRTAPGVVVHEFVEV